MRKNQKEKGEMRKRKSLYVKINDKKLRKTLFCSRTINSIQTLGR